MFCIQAEMEALRAEVARKREREKIEELRLLKLRSKQTSLKNELEQVSL